MNLLERHHTRKSLSTAEIPRSGNPANERVLMLGSSMPIVRSDAKRIIVECQCMQYDNSDDFFRLRRTTIVNNSGKRGAAALATVSHLLIYLAPKLGS